MRAFEFINEVLNISGTAPATNWQSDVDPWGNKVAVGQWQDPTGRQIQNLFQKDPKGDVTMTFTRQTAKGEPSYAVTHGGKGKQASIMTGVTQNIIDYIKSNPDVSQFKFSSSADSRTRLYNKMLDRLAPQMGMVATSTYDPELERTNYILRKAQSGEVHAPLATARPQRPPAQPLTGPKISLKRPPGYKQSGIKSGGGSGGVGVSDPRDTQMGAELDPKAMMQRFARP